MGSGKTLAAIEAMEASGLTNWLWVGPRSALASVELEFSKWQSFIRPKFVTYTSLQRHNETWIEDVEVYQGIVFDESSRVKNSVAKRSIASQYLADWVRVEHEDDGFVIEMSGSPAPQSPLDWYSQCEIAMPGFLKEGHVNKLKERLAVIHQRESAAGGVYPHLVTWLDDAQKCTECGEYEDHEFHDPCYVMEHDVEDSPYHPYKPAGKNEVGNLYTRMKGLVLVKFKKACLDLPDKQYRVVHCEPLKRTMRAAKMIAKTSPSTIKALTLLRQLSDGFQYSEEEVGKETCGVCMGKRVVNQPNYIGPEKTVKYLRSIEALPSWYNGVEMTDERVLDEVIIDPVKHPDLFKWMDIACTHCNGVGEVVTYERSTEKIICQKIDALKELLDEHDDVGRIVVYGGFTGSVDICCDTIREVGWEVLRVDGRGWHCSIEGLDSLGMLKAFQELRAKHPKMAFVGQPGAAGMGLTLTASPSIVYYSNDFNAESRIQSEDRIHRPGMDLNLGATIIDLIHLPSDEYVLNNLQAKRDLQSMSLGDLASAFQEYPDE
jgi:SNF2 family DNA or RNA helicase